MYVFQHANSQNTHYMQKISVFLGYVKMGPPPFHFEKVEGAACRELAMSLRASGVNLAGLDKYKSAMLVRRLDRWLDTIMSHPITKTS